MQSFKVISLDMFQTLVNIESRRAEVWRPILQQKFSEARALQLGKQLLSRYYAAACEAREAGTFISSREIYYRGFQSVFQESGLDCDCEQAVDNPLPNTGCPKCTMTQRPSYSAYAGIIKCAL